VWSRKRAGEFTTRRGPIGHRRRERQIDKEEKFKKSFQKQIN
jgi:hypothetical protein